MSDYAPRCPFCANVLKLQPTFWEKIGLRSHKATCPTCQRPCELRDAETMGSAYFHWSQVFRKELVEALEALPVLAEAAMHKALGSPHRDETHLMPSVEELVRTCIRHHRAVLVEMARGREATLEVAVLENEGTLMAECVAILGTTSGESGGKERAQLIARHGSVNYVVFDYPDGAGAEPRVKRAVQAKGKGPRALTDAHVVGQMGGKVGRQMHHA